MCEPLEMGAKRKGRLRQVVCYRVEGENEGMDLVGGGSKDPWLGYLFYWLKFPAYF